MTYPLALAATADNYEWRAGWRHGDHASDSDIVSVHPTRQAAVHWLKQELSWIAIDEPGVTEDEREVALSAASKVDEANVAAFGKNNISLYHRGVTYYVERIMK